MASVAVVPPSPGAVRVRAGVQKSARNVHRRTSAGAGVWRHSAGRQRSLEVLMYDLGGGDGCDAAGTARGREGPDDRRTRQDAGRRTRSRRGCRAGRAVVQGLQGDPGPGRPRADHPRPSGTGRSPVHALPGQPRCRQRGPGPGGPGRPGLGGRPLRSRPGQPVRRLRHRLHQRRAAALPARHLLAAARHPDPQGAGAAGGQGPATPSPPPSAAPPP
jgi:hypothetical protein